MTSFDAVSTTVLQYGHMELKMYICNDSTDFATKYRSTVEKHNDSVSTSEFPDAGFDLLCPSDMQYKLGGPKKYPLGVKCSANMVTREGHKFPCGFMMFPRSSLSKTSLRLANGTGIIDSGYRGELMGAFDCFYKDYKVEAGNRLLQIVAPGMVPIKVFIVDSESQLGTETVRGSGGFGSTGV
jgi:dUTP pyrophosphatase